MILGVLSWARKFRHKKPALVGRAARESFLLSGSRWDIEVRSGLPGLCVTEGLFGHSGAVATAGKSSESCGSIAGD